MTASDTSLNWEFLLNAYANGYFPMAMSHEEEELHWFYPEKRGIIPLDAFHVPQSLGKFIRKSPFHLTTNQAFPDVIRACGQVNDKRKETWINPVIIDLYCQLWERGYAHSVECWLKPPSADGAVLNHIPCEDQQVRSGDNTLVGGLYGVAIGGAFFGESMFSIKPNASRVALVHLVGLLKKGGYQLLDTQFVNEHLRQFGVIEIARKDYLARLGDALMIKTKEVFD